MEKKKWVFGIYLTALALVFSIALTEGRDVAALRAISDSSAYYWNYLLRYKF